MRLDGFGLFVEDMAKMIKFYRDVLGFEIKESEDTSNVYLVKCQTAHCGRRKLCIDFGSFALSDCAA